MLTKIANALAESGCLSDNIIRGGIRALLRQRLKEIKANTTASFSVSTQQVLDTMKSAAIADLPGKANEQHYEVPSDFFIASLGEQLKYSCGYWPAGTHLLDSSENEALILTCQHANLQDGQNILELGCGWGSLTLHMANQYPNSQITAVSNSQSQAKLIRQRAWERGLQNVQVITEDMNVFDIDSRFDRVVSVEMFEHMRNWEQLFTKVSRWLKPGGQFFMHIFVHKTVPYFFEDKDESDWMSRHFFSGGLMPSYDLPLSYQQQLKLEQRWKWDGNNYAKTSNAWLKKMDDNKRLIWPLFVKTYGKKKAQAWWMRWRIFYMACAELFAYNGGNEWFVGHYVFSKLGK